MREYNHKKIEGKWQTYWEKKKLNRATENAKKQKFYGLIEFPYPSGDGLHVGHIRSNTAMDIISRKRRAEGYEVLYPVGWDAFGLPTENYAIKTGIEPSVVTKKNTGVFRRQLKALGFSFDWSREINTTDPAYYRWTQWIFLQFFKHGLAYKKKMAINWCPKDKIGLANEEVVDGACERCGTPVEKREKEQWMLAITKYAERLEKDLDTVNFLERIKIQQKNWIGRSEGVNFKCKIKDLGIEVEMYNSVPQTYRAETFTVIAPEHALVPKLVADTKYEKPVSDFVAELKRKRMQKDFDAEKEMEGIFTGRYIENYAGTGRDLPIWIASYVVADYGTGIVNASAHDERDFKFAQKFNIPLHPVAEPLIVKTTGEDAVKPELGFRERNAVVCVIKHWSEDKYLSLAWKQNDWKGFVIGGIEDGEDAAAAGVREIHEETGYKSAKCVRNLGTVHSQFYQKVKKENRFAHFQCLYFELQNGEQDAVAEKEHALHDIRWVSKNDVADFINREDMKLIWERAQGTPRPVIKNGILLEPQEFKGREWHEVRPDIIEYLVKKGYATRAVHYKLRDWVFSRQRYWGEPIPLVFCEECKTRAETVDPKQLTTDFEVKGQRSKVKGSGLSLGERLNPGWFVVPEKDLPVKLPKVKNYKPTDTGESPLATISSWVNVKCPLCKGPAKRETDTMPNWAGSSWYYLAYAMHRKLFPRSKVKGQWSNVLLDYWTPVDWYNGGMEHTTLHLLYSRFWHKFLFDLGLVPTSEPYAKRTSHGLILGEGGVKMSKSVGNVVNPDSIVKTYGADTLRLYEMFMGPFDQHIAWSSESIIGPRRFLERVWRLFEKTQNTVLKNQTNHKDQKPNKPQAPNSKLESLVHQTIKKVSEDIEAMRFNTAVSALMILANEMEKSEALARVEYEILLRLLAPFAPHITEELWIMLGNRASIHTEPWPVFDAKLAESGVKTMVVQINGKVRANMSIEGDVPEEEVKNRALALGEIKKWVEHHTVKKVIHVKGRLINIVI